MSLFVSFFSASVWLPVFAHAGRLLLAVVGGYGLSAQTMAGLAAALAWLGMADSEATVLCTMLAFLVHLGLLLWAYAEQSWCRLLACLLVLPVALQALAVWWLP